MNVTLIVLTDGRLDCLDRTLAALDATIGVGAFTQRVIVNDSANTGHQRILAGRYGDTFTIRPPLRRKRGFGGAIREAWAAVDGDADYVFHLEDDFTIDRPVPLPAMAAALDAHPHIIQFALRRQPWNGPEKAAGGVVEQWPDLYVDVEWQGHHWLEHDLFFTTNPSLYRAGLLDVGWPTGAGSEMNFTRNLQALDHHHRFAFWGARSDPPWVTHIGEQRVGIGY